MSYGLRARWLGEDAPLAHSRVGVEAYILIKFTHGQQTKHIPTKSGNAFDEIAWAARSQRILGKLFITTITKTITILSGPFSYMVTCQPDISPCTNACCVGAHTRLVAPGTKWSRLQVYTPGTSEC